MVAVAPDEDSPHTDDIKIGYQPQIVVVTMGERLTGTLGLLPLPSPPENLPLAYSFQIGPANAGSNTISTHTLFLLVFRMRRSKLGFSSSHLRL